MAKLAPIAAKTAAGGDIDLGVLNDVIGFRIRRIQTHLSRGFAERIQREEFKPGLFAALALISANPGISQTRLSQVVGFDKATVVALLDTLEALGWAERLRAPDDRRRHALYATDEGRLAMTEIHVEAVANEEGVRQALTAAEMRQLFNLLDKVYEALFVSDPAD